MDVHETVESQIQQAESFHELHWAEDLGSGTRNILRYAPLYYPRYKVEINSGSQFIFSITYQDVIVQENVTDNVKMSLTEGKNVTDSGQMSLTEAENVPELTPEELDLSLEPKVMKSVKEKKKRRKQAIVGLMDKDSRISIETIAEKLDVHKRTILRDIDELKKDLVIERIGGDFGGEWKVLKKKK